MRHMNFSSEESDYNSYGRLSGLIGIDAVDPAGSTARLTSFSNSMARLWLLVCVTQFVALTIIAGPSVFQDIWFEPAAMACLMAMVMADLIVVLAPSAGWRFNLWRGHVYLMQMAGAVMACISGLFLLYNGQQLATDSTHLSVMAGHLAIGLPVFAVLAGNRLMFGVYAATMALALVALYVFSFISLGLALIVCFSIYALHYVQKRDSASAAAAAHDRREFERAALLLAAYEKSGNGIFWETDRQGKIIYISPSVVQHFGETGDALIGQSLSSLLVSDTKEGGAEERTLGFHLYARSPFRDLAVQTRAPGENEQWWSISGAPIYNDLGHFRGFRGHGTNLTAMKRSEQENTQLARYDALTGLANRLHIKQLFEKSLTVQSGQSQPCSILLLDLDKFKQVNDTLGHPIGDLLLQQVARRLQRVIGDKGQVGRLGGDEFQVILPQIINREKLATLATEVIAALSKPYFLESHRVNIGASIGIVAFDRGKPDSAALIRNADLALYAAKAAGRGTYRFYESDMHAMAAERQKIEEELRVALSENQFDIVYQPVVNVSSEQISGFEALIRWNHPRLGRYSPANFIPIAEETGLITGIGEWVLRNACEQAANWPDHIRVAVNVSPVQFLDPSFISTLLSVLASSRISPDQLELEITEGIFLNESDETFRIFQKLKQIGVRLVLDDFGTGYSALGYLKKAPFDKIKIDQSFVRGASKPGSINSAIITSIVTLAESLGMETTAEGAETHDELERVRALGCSHLQGYIFGKPMPATAALQLLEDHEGLAVADGYRKSREKRIRMLRKVALYHDDHRYEASIRNLSTNGALVEGLWDVPEGTKFAIELSRHMKVECETRWSSENRMGVRFVESIDLEQLTRKKSASPIMTTERRMAG